MDNSDLSRSRHNGHLAVNRMSRNIRKSPPPQPSFTNPKPQPQPHVYNISKSDFRTVVQQLTGSPSHDRPPPVQAAPPQHPPKPSSLRLQKIRPPPLSPISRPPILPSVHGSLSSVNPHMYPGPRSPHLSRLPESFHTLPSSDSLWPQIVESPISAYMRYLQSSITDPSPRLNPPSPHAQPLPSSCILQAPSPALPSPQCTGSGPFPSPTSQFLLPSPGFLSLLSPRSPYPLLSPGFQYPPPLTPSFSFLASPRSSGILGSGPLPSSPGFVLPPSPSGFLSMLSPRWGD